VGRLYSFKPTATDADGDPLSFSVLNKPSWASFDTATGALFGTPSLAGEYPNIAIRASDGLASSALAPFSITVAPLTLGAATVSWSPPKTNVDGTAATALAGYRVLYGTDPTRLNTVLDVPNPTITSVRIEQLSAGTWYFAVKAYTAQIESSPSTAVWKTLN
jgi:hypothetical protein